MQELPIYSLHSGKTTLGATVLSSKVGVKPRDPRSTNCAPLPVIEHMPGRTLRRLLRGAIIGAVLAVVVIGAASAMGSSDPVTHPAVHPAVGGRPSGSNGTGTHAKPGRVAGTGQAHRVKER